MSIPFIEENDQTQARQEHLEALHQLVGNAYPNKFERSDVVEQGKEDTITAIVGEFRAFEPKAPEGERPPTQEIELANQQITQKLNEKSVRVAGRIASPPRDMGRAAFLHLTDGKSRVQVYLKKTEVKGINNAHNPLDLFDGTLDANQVSRPHVDGLDLFNLLDQGDFIGVEGPLFITKSGELSIHAEALQFLSKALLPMPSKIEGISSPEVRQRQRYADLIAGSLRVERKNKEADSQNAEALRSHQPKELSTREVFEMRSRVIREMRRILDDNGYIEVETPMLTPLATGAAAKPFKTHHNALDIDLFARIAPELYLKRMLVGGFEKVYELNRNFRNEGLSSRHNPEFTMLEFYWAYADVNQMMDFCEQMLRSTVFTALGHTHVHYGQQDIDFSQPFARLTMKEAVLGAWKRFPFRRYVPEGIRDQLEQDWPRNISTFSTLMFWLVTTSHTISADQQRMLTDDEFEQLIQPLLSLNWENIQLVGEALDTDEGEKAKNLQRMFDNFVEPFLNQPTFIMDFPKVVSPLSKASPSDPSVAERFELFIAGMEIANGFSELNDPKEQYERFKDQVDQRERGDEEAMVMDEDYIRALSYGMPPAAGIGIGIDRFVMLVTNRQSIRDVILFPHMRPEKKSGEDAEQVADEEGIANSGRDTQR